jgi:hypothetical protein
VARLSKIYQRSSIVLRPWLILFTASHADRARPHPCRAPRHCVHDGRISSSHPDSTQPLTRHHQRGTVLVGRIYWTPEVLLGLFTIIYCGLPLLTVLVMY